MKNRYRSIEAADLDPVAYFEEDFVLFIDSEDENIPTSLCVLANFETLQFDSIQPMDVFLKSKSYLPILDVDARISQRQRLFDEMPPEAIAAMLHDFNKKKRLIQKKLLPTKEMFPEWHPGG